MISCFASDETLNAYTKYPQPFVEGLVKRYYVMWFDSQRFYEAPCYHFKEVFHGMPPKISVHSATSKLLVSNMHKLAHLI